MALNIELLQQSFDKARPIGAEVVDAFYTFLLTDNPDLVDVFRHADMSRQKDALLKSLIFIVDNLETPERVVTYLTDLGERHAPYQVDEAEYQKVGTALLKSFAYFFEDEWTAELEEAWTEAYGFIASTMLAGTRAARTPTS